MPYRLKQLAGVLGGFSLALALMISVLYAVGYTIQINWTNPPPALSPPKTPAVPVTVAPPSPAATAAPPTGVPPTAPSAVATATLEAVAGTTPRPATLDTTGPPFRLLLEGTPTALTWAAAQNMVLPGSGDRLVVDRVAVQAWVAVFMQAHNRPAQGAAFRWNALSRQPEIVQESRGGTAVDQAATVDRLVGALESATAPTSPCRSAL